nr:reverse transcriptase domain-containing protein [Tanacetum cinerariifolium]
ATTTAGHHLRPTAAAEKVFRRDFPANSEMIPPAPIGVVIFITTRSVPFDMYLNRETRIWLLRVASPAIVEPLRIEIPFLEDQFQEDPPKDPPEVSMADDRTMAKLLRAPTEGYEDAIVILKIAANNFELKHGLINLVQNKQFFGHDKEDPHAHIRYFNKITSTMRVPNVPSSSIKLMIFPFSLEGAARIWLEKEAP